VSQPSTHCPCCGQLLPPGVKLEAPAAARVFRQSVEKLPRKSPSGEYHFDLERDPESEP